MGEEDPQRIQDVLVATVEHVITHQPFVSIDLIVLQDSEVTIYCRDEANKPAKPYNVSFEPYDEVKTKASKFLFLSLVEVAFSLNYPFFSFDNRALVRLTGKGNELASTRDGNTVKVTALGRCTFTYEYKSVSDAEKAQAANAAYISKIKKMGEDNDFQAYAENFERVWLTSQTKVVKVVPTQVQQEMTATVAVDAATTPGEGEEEEVPIPQAVVVADTTPNDENKTGNEVAAVGKQWDTIPTGKPQPPPSSRRRAPWASSTQSGTGLARG